jgi:hypothetical protein
MTLRHGRYERGTQDAMLQRRCGKCTHALPDPPAAVSFGLFPQLPVPVTARANFSVVVGLNVPSDVYPIPVEQGISGISNRNDSSAFIPVPPLKAIGCGSCRIPQRPVQPVFDRGEADGSLSKFCPIP